MDKALVILCQSLNTLIIEKIINKYKLTVLLTKFKRSIKHHHEPLLQWLQIFVVIRLLMTHELNDQLMPE